MLKQGYESLRPERHEWRPYLPASQRSAGAEALGRVQCAPGESRRSLDIQRRRVAVIGQKDGLPLLVPPAQVRRLQTRN